ncbi:unnamed protein product, partial [Didymodactylos carnosus]
KDDVAIRHQYEKFGVTEYYRQFGAKYRNPHEEQIKIILKLIVERWHLLSDYRVLDLACGSGECTLALRSLGFTSIDGIDPYTADAYYYRTGQKAQTFTFANIADGCLEDFYDVIICSFALHLVEQSWLPALMIQLKFISNRLIILSPHKRPFISPEWGWILKEEFVENRIHAKLYTTDLTE